MKLKFIPVDGLDEVYIDCLFELLQEREKDESISHKEMPTYLEHIKFVQSDPYERWFIIFDEDEHDIVGSVYITKKNEIGIAIYKNCSRRGYAKAVLSKFNVMHSVLDNFSYYTRSPFYANINPANTKSIALFEQAGFKHIQNTYKLDLIRPSETTSGPKS